MKEKRQRLWEHSPKSGEKITKIFNNFFDFPPHTLMGFYWPLKYELDIRPLLYTLLRKGFICALPCSQEEGLLFRLWTPLLTLVPGQGGGCLEPSAESSSCVPDVLLVPLVAFDKKGYRLGYGKGYYDRYLQHHSSFTIGVGFSGQEVKEVPQEPHDIPLNFIMTEKEVIQV